MTTAHPSTPQHPPTPPPTQTEGADRAHSAASGARSGCRHQMQSFQHWRGEEPRTTCRLCGQVLSDDQQLIPAQARMLAAMETMEAAAGGDTPGLGCGWTVGVICGDGRIRAISERVWAQRADVSAVIEDWDDTHPHSIVAASALVPLEV